MFVFISEEWGYPFLGNISGCNAHNDDKKHLTKRFANKGLGSLELWCTLVANTSRSIYIFNSSWWPFLFSTPLQRPMVEKSNVVTGSPQLRSFVVLMAKVMHPKGSSIHLSSQEKGGQLSQPNPTFFSEKDIPPEHKEVRQHSSKLVLRHRDFVASQRFDKPNHSVMTHNQTGYWVLKNWDPTNCNDE